MDEVRGQLKRFLGSLITNNPRITQEGKVHSLFYLEGQRMGDLYKSIDDTDTTLRPFIKPPLNNLLGQLWQLANHQYYWLAATAVFAFYDDGTILWLDSHVDDNDFKQFVEQEELLLLDAKLAAEIILATKLHYLSVGLPSQVIESIDDIPAVDFRKYRANGRVANIQEWENNYNQLMMSLKPLLYEPQFHSSKTAKILEFYFWTHAMGQVYKTQFSFENKALTWKAELIGNGYGSHLTVR